MACQKSIWFGAVSALVLAPIGVGALIAPQEAYAGPICGSTLTTNLILTTNLNCSGTTGAPALTIGANGIIVDMKGFTISGPGGESGTDGVYSDGHSNVTIEHGSIKNFAHDVYVQGGVGLDVKYAKLLLDGFQQYNGFFSDDTSDGQLTGLYVNDASTAGEIEFSSNMTVSNSIVKNSANGFYDFETRGDTYNNDHVLGSSSCGPPPPPQATQVCGEQQPQDGQQSGPTAFYAEFSSGETYYGNVAQDYNYGFYVSNEGDGPATLQNNIAEMNSSAGIYLFENYTSPCKKIKGVCVVGGSITTSSTNEIVSGNEVDHNFQGIYDNGSVGAAITGNDGSYNTDGIVVDYPTAYWITNNTMDDNYEVGFNALDNSVKYPPTSGSNNTADYNSSGFVAQYPMPGSGNTAKGNSDTNCYNWVCS